MMRGTASLRISIDYLSEADFDQGQKKESCKTKAVKKKEKELLLTGVLPLSRTPYRQKLFLRAKIQPS